MARSRVGGIDDPIWLAPADPRPEVLRRPWRNWAALLLVTGLPALAVVLHGFDWVSMVAGVGAATATLLFLYRRPLGVARAGPSEWIYYGLSGGP